MSASQMKAIVIENANAVIKEIPVPELEDNDVLVKVEYVALNPTDWKHVKMRGSVDGAIVGCDFSGSIVKLGSGLKNPSLKVGDRVATAIHGGKFKDKGSFAEYLRVETDLTFKVPDSLSSRDAASYGIPWMTAAHVMWDRLGLPQPPQKADGSEWVIIYGGSSSAGLFAIQLAKKAGYKVVSTASPKNFDLVKSYGADEVVDYHDADAAAKQIREITNNTLTKGLDCISDGDSTKICLEAYSDRAVQKRLQVLLPQPQNSKAISQAKGVDVEFTLTYTLYGRAFHFVPGVDYPDTPAERAFYAKLNKDTPRYITEEGIRPNPLIEGEGFEGILEGLKKLEQGQVSGAKLVYKL